MHQSQAHRNPGKGERTTKVTMRITKRHKKLTKACSFVAFRLLLCLLCTGPRFVEAAEHRVVGLTSSGMRIEAAVVRSEERRVGKECRSGRWAEQSKKNAELESHSKSLGSQSNASEV